MDSKEGRQDPLGGEIAVQDEKDVAIHDAGSGSDKATGLKLDPHGLPLRPQPSSDPRGT